MGRDNRENSPLIQNIKEVLYGLGWIPFVFTAFLALGLFGTYVIEREFPERAPVDQARLDETLFESLLSSGEEMPGPNVEGLFAEDRSVTSVVVQQEGSSNLVLEFDPDGNYYRLRPADDESADWRYYRLPGIGRSLQHEFNQ